MNSNRSSKKQILALVIALLVFVLVIAGISPVVAYYIRGTEKIEGNYEPGKPSNPGLTDSPPVRTQRIAFLSDTETSLNNLYIQIPDQGYPVYVRVAVVVNWLKLTDCTCAESRCKDETCPNCPDCEDDCEDCTGCIDCANCGGVIECEDCGEACPDCEDGDCEDCTEYCTGCNNCRKEDEHCEECAGCAGKACLDCTECPLCNEDESDDWDIIFPQPTAEGEKPDYALTIGDTWKKVEGNGFYYHKTAVSSSGSATGGLITVDSNTNTPFIVAFERLSSAKLPIDKEGLDAKDCILKVEVIVQTLQAVGSTDLDDDAAWVDAWGEGLDEWPKKGQ